METLGKKNGYNSKGAVSLNELCRLCLAKKKTMLPIYDGRSGDVPIPVKLMACVNLEVYRGDGLPTMICQLCKDNLDQSYQFKRKCHDAHTKLNKHKNLITDLYQVESEDNDQEPEDTTVEKLRPIKRRLSESILSEDEVTSVNSELFKAKKSKFEGNYNSTMIGITDAEESIGERSSDLLEMIDDSNEIGGNYWAANNSAMKNTYMMEEFDEDSGSINLQPAEENNDSWNGELKVFKCDKCPKAFTRRIMLKSHQTVHSTQRGFTCQACEKWFPTQSALTRHERTHTGEKPFGCNICQRAFSQKEILLRHLMTHSGQKPYQCEDCDKSFTQREALRVHMRRHQKLDPNDIKLYHCQLCSKAFCHASGLSRHLVTHTGRTYKCVECEKSFTDKSSLLRHCRIHAPRI